MNKEEMKKKLGRRISVRFGIEALICLAIFIFLSGAAFVIFKQLPEPGEVSLAPEAEELIEKVDGVFVQNGNASEWQELKLEYEALSEEAKAQVPENYYDKILEAISLSEWLEKETNRIVVKDKSRNGYDIQVGTGNAELRERDGRIVFEGHTDVTGEETEETFQRVFNGNGSFTIEAEVNPNGWGFGNDDFNVIVSKGDSCTSLRISGQKAYFFIKNTEGEWITAEKNLTREQMNSWIHVAGIYNGTDVSVYVEGSELVTTRNAGVCAVSDYPFSIGYCPETGRISTASIRNLHVYSQALTKNELDQRNYEADSENVVLWYDFGDYSYLGIDVESKGIRSYTESIKLAAGETGRIQAELIPYYAEGEIIYSTNNEKVAVVSGDGVVTGVKSGEAAVTALVNGTDYSVTIPVKVDEFGHNLYRVLEWLMNRIVLIDILAFAFVLLILSFIQRRQLLDWLVELSGAVAHIGKNPEEVELPPVLHEVQSTIREVAISLQQKEYRAGEAEKRKNDLVVYLAHDLKTPIASIMGYLTLLRDEKQISPELHQHYIEIILNNVERLDDLIDEFFEITRFNLSHITLNYSEINLTWLLEQMVAEIRPMFAEKRLTCILDVPKNVRIRCDPDKLERVFDNLLRNAISYSFPDTEICISITTGEDVILKFANHGETVSKENLGRIFEQFFRMDSSRASRTGGSGLGLAIAKQIVELHHGNMEAESSGDVICFTIRLPFSENTGEK